MGTADDLRGPRGPRRSADRAGLAGRAVMGRWTPYAILPLAGGAAALTRPPPPASPSQPAPEDPLTSNVGQSYPYTSESEADRAAKIAALVTDREDLAGKLVAEVTPPDDGDRWWVWKCPTHGCPGLLHVAGYARDLHALYVVCDGTCQKTFLR